MERKNKLRRWLDNLIWLFKNKELNEWYNSYGLDVVGLIDESDYLAHSEFNRDRNSQMKRSDLENKCSYGGLLTDKYVFTQYLRKVLGDNFTTKTIALMRGRKVFALKNNEIVDIKDILMKINHDVILKPLNEASGRGIFLIKRIEDKFYINGKLIENIDSVEFSSNERRVIEEVVINHDEIAKFNPHKHNKNYHCSQW